jgi:hypothetical protein
VHLLLDLAQIHAAPLERSPSTKAAMAARSRGLGITSKDMVRGMHVTWWQLQQQRRGARHNNSGQRRRLRRLVGAAPTLQVCLLCSCVLQEASRLVFVYVKDSKPRRWGGGRLPGEQRTRAPPATPPCCRKCTARLLLCALQEGGHSRARQLHTGPVPQPGTAWQAGRQAHAMAPRLCGARAAGGQLSTPPTHTHTVCTGINRSRPSSS